MTQTHLKGICTISFNECYGLIVAIQMESTQIHLRPTHTHTQIQPLGFCGCCAVLQIEVAQVASSFVGKVAAEILPSQCLRLYQLDQEKTVDTRPYLVGG